MVFPISLEVTFSPCHWPSFLRQMAEGDVVLGKGNGRCVRTTLSPHVTIPTSYSEVSEFHTLLFYRMSMLLWSLMFCFLLARVVDHFV